jgi:hypothetical protein
MDWIKTFNRGQWIIHGVFLTALLFAVGSTIFSLRLKNLQNTEESRMEKINGLVIYFKEDQTFTKVGKFLGQVDTDHAQEKLRELSQKIALAEELLEIKANKDLTQSIKNFNGLIGHTAGMSSPTDALKVFKQKASSLESFAKSKGYRNVGIIAARMHSRLEELNSKNVAGSIQVTYLKTDLARVKQLVNSSGLTDGEKKPLNDKFDSMKNEIDLLGSVNSQSRDLKVVIKDSSLALAQWGLDLEKKSKDLSGLRDRKQNQLIILLAGMVGFLVVSWMGLAYLFRWQKTKIGIDVESEVKNVVERGIIGDQRFMIDHYSDTTRLDIIHLLDELKVKLNLGSMLHEGLPFAGCMIDGHFKLSWFNQLFLEQFYLSEEEIRSDSFNWDYLRDYLNLSEDPIYEAMVNKIAGIYPVKMKQDEFTPMQPYEMYVTPISANREDKVMVFFYPLISSKEAISEQVGMSRATLGRFVTLWNEEKLDEDELRLLERDFDNNDLRSTYKELSELYYRLNNEKDEFIHTIRSLEKEKSSLEFEVTEWEKTDAFKKDIVKEELKVMHEMRDMFLNSVDRSESLMNLNRTVLQQNDDLKAHGARLGLMASETVKKNRETAEIMGQLEGVKVDYKKLKFELLEVKTRLISINNSLFGQLPVLDETQQKLAMRYKDELARLDLNVSVLDKKLSQLDILLGKLQMMNEKAPTEQPALQFQTSQKDHEIREALFNIQKTSVGDQKKMVETFKSLHSLIKKDLAAAPQTNGSTMTDLDNFLS